MFEFIPYFGENGVFKPTENNKEEKEETKGKQINNDPIEKFLDMLFGDGDFIVCDGHHITKDQVAATCGKRAPRPTAPGMQVKFPGIARVQFNLKTTDYKRDLDAEPKTIVVKGQKKVVYPYLKNSDGKKIEIAIDPVLATIVYFNDGTKVVVTNSETDKVDLVDVKMADGTVVKTASNQAKERAVIYAIIKRLYGTPDKLGTIENVGLARRLNDIVQNGYDTRLQDAKNRIAEAARKAAAAKAQKPAKKRYSIAETLARINTLLDKAEAGDSDALKKLAGALA